MVTIISDFVFQPQPLVESPKKEDTFFKDIEQEASGILQQEHHKAKKKQENKTQVSDPRNSLFWKYSFAKEAVNVNP